MCTRCPHFEVQASSQFILAEALKHHDATLVKSVRLNAKTDMHVMQKQTGTFRKNWS